MKEPSGVFGGSVSFPRTLWNKTGGFGDQTSDCLIGRRPAVPPALQPLTILSLPSLKVQNTFSSFPFGCLIWNWSWFMSETPQLDLLMINSINNNCIYLFIYFLESFRQVMFGYSKQSLLKSQGFDWQHFIFKFLHKYCINIVNREYFRKQ